MRGRPETWEPQTLKDRVFFASWVWPVLDGLMFALQIYNEGSQDYKFELWFPVLGYAGYYDESAKLLHLIGQLFPTQILVPFDRQQGYSEDFAYNLQVSSGQRVELQFYLRVPLDYAERMRRIAEDVAWLRCLLPSSFRS